MIENKIIAAYVQRLAANRERRNNSIKELSYDGDNWAGIYVPETKVMLGGANIDSETFYDDFLITEVDEENAQDALKYCAGLFVEYDRITMSFKELKGTYEESCRRDELICSF
jgi:hypothetical protein